MVLPLTYGCSAAKISPEFALVSLLAGYWHSWSSSVFVNWTIWPGHYREEKCDVMLPWLQKFWTSRIFLDRDGHLHCPTMEEKYGLSFCPWVQCTGNSYVPIFSSFFPVIVCWDPRKFWYHGYVTHLCLLPINKITSFLQRPINFSSE